MNLHYLLRYVLKLDHAVFAVSQILDATQQDLSGVQMELEMTQSKLEGAQQELGVTRNELKVANSTVQLQTQRLSEKQKCIDALFAHQEVSTMFDQAYVCHATAYPSTPLYTSAPEQIYYSYITSMSEYSLHSNMF